MITLSSIDSFKMIADLQVDLIPGGVAYFIVMGDEITWKLASKVFDLPNLKVGVKPSKDGGAMRAIKLKTTITDKIPRSVYGIRISVTSTPIVDDAGEIVGALSIAFPRLHAVVAGFADYAPVFAEMFSEGAMIYATDLNRIINKQPSAKFDLPTIKVGYELKETDIAYQAIKSKKVQTQAVSADRYGVPVMIINYPLFSEDDVTEVVGTLGVVMPKAIQSELRDMSNNLTTGLRGIASAIEDLTVSASLIQVNEQSLNANVKEVFQLSEEINKISTYIKGISDQTNMLGLNAAIEAARAGEAGRGFSIVAEEIRKLSDQSKSTVPRIKHLTDSINSKINEVGKKSQESMSSSLAQAAAAEEINAGTEELISMANQLDNIAKTMV